MNLKRIVSALSALVLSLSLVSCTSGNPASREVPGTNIEATAAPEASNLPENTNTGIADTWVVTKYEVFLMSYETGI